MAKTIAVDSRFQDLIETLRARGYEVVDLYSGHTGVEACIYYDGIRDFHNTDYSRDAGVLMIDGKGRSIDDIEAILQRGVYSSLF
ncbi:MAG: hypothetical protein GXY97_03145 [Clostridiales bacterium]|jgi:hypothetical protein|nr:hypothetical protein [Clostridiales bacterium]HOC08280.1 YkuS family protein [Bacillota bacterium]HQD42380.1 YkuS family protein [Bacillota bacterium]